MEGKFEQAMNYLTKYAELNDSLTIAISESKVLEIENRYKHQKLMTENAELKLRQTGYLLTGAICLIAAFIVLAVYFSYRKRTEKKLLLQQADIRETRNRLLEVSIEIERKNALLKHSEEVAETFGRRKKGISPTGSRTADTDQKLSQLTAKHAKNISYLQEAATVGTP